MFRKREQIVPTHFDKCHGGHGEVTALEFFHRGEVGSGFQFFHDTTVPAGASIGLHRHHNNAEIYYLLSGEADFYLDGHRYAMRPGDLGVVQDGQTHKIVNTGSTPLRLIVVESGEEDEAENITDTDK